MSYMKHHLARLEMMMAEEHGNDLPYKQAYNDQLMIEANGIKIELHKQENVKSNIKTIKVMKTSDAIYITVMGVLFLIWVVELVKILIRNK